MIKDFVTTGSLGRPVRKKVYVPENPEAVVVVIHGMQEHSGRYDNFAKIMMESNIAVFTSDLRGHGSNIDGRPGLDEGNIFLNIVEDQKAIIKKAREHFPSAKIVVLGHSYGSFVTQRLIRDRVEADKFILSGSSFMKGALISMGGLVANLSRIFKGREADANLVEALSIRGYGKKFENGNWLSRDEKVWDDYNRDPLCGQVFPVAFYQSMFKELPKNYKKLKNSVGYAPKILVMSGTDDPVGNFSRGVKKLSNVYKASGYDTEVKLYDGGRHEMLNEINKDEVINDIIEFIRK